MGRERRREGVSEEGEERKQERGGGNTGEAKEV